MDDAREATVIDVDDTEVIVRPDGEDRLKPTGRERVVEVLEPVLGRLRGDATPAKAMRMVLMTIAFFFAVKVVFGPPNALFLFGIATGALYGLIAVGIILIYRTNRIINFAAAAIGAVPAVFAVLLQAIKGTPYWLTFVISVVGGLALGGLSDFLVIRRFRNAPRLILTVATIGIAQLLAFVCIHIPGWLGSEDITANVKTPWASLRVETSSGNLLYNGDYIFSVVMVLAMAGGLAAFFRFTKMGIALRASAENADRALLLGIPVKTVGTISWMIAGLFGAMTIFLRSPLVGVPVDGTLGYQVLLFAFAAAVMARMESVSLAVLAGFAVGILEQSSVYSTGSNDLSAAIMLAFILGTLLLQRGKLSRAQDSGISTWQALKEYRPIPTELRKVPMVVGARWAVGAVLLAFVLLAPTFVSRGEVAKMSLVPIFAIVAVSLVILTGWAGQISLGQFALVGAGAVTAGKLATDFSQDFFVTLIAGCIVGAIVAVIVGLPAVRIQGLFLAVTTLSLAGATQYYFLKRNYSFGSAVLPSSDNSRIARPMLWERIDLAPERNYYYFCLAFLALVLLAAKSFRKHRSGRVVIATRDNSRAAPAFAINLVRTRLAAFAVAGAIAGLAGVLQVYQSQSVDASTYGLVPSVNVFVAAVIGGLTSLAGGVAGAVIVQSVYLFGDPRIDGISFLVTGPGLLLMLMFMPGGFAQLGFGIRDKFLRWVAARNDIHVPSLVADRRIETGEGEEHMLEDAQAHVDATESFDVSGPRRIVCPVCHVALTVDDAADHDHLKPVGAEA
ncbi:MAG TPA: ABC transporter permease [Acidimicrobiales bacterium]|nr:ABC transporter permease [Acidimicrobiales bacterium]